MRFAIISLVLYATVVCASPEAGLGLAAAAKLAGKTYYGTMTDNPQLKDVRYVEQLSNSSEFNLITPVDKTNPMVWDATEAKQGVFNFTKADDIVNFAKQNDQLTRGRTLVWHSQLPAWVSTSKFDGPTLEAVIVNHITKLVDHFKDAWDVVNEPLNEDGSFRPTIFYNALNTTFVATALKAARAADPEAKLYISDHGIEGSSPKTNALIELLKSLKVEGIPIDGVGLEGHFTSGKIPKDLQANMEEIASYGVELAFTELDISVPLPPTSEDITQQEADFHYVASTCKAVKACVGITTWDYTDKYSWLSFSSNTRGLALPWDEDLMKKPAYVGIYQGLLS